MQPPANPRIYHITHVSNLARIVQEDALLSEAAVAVSGGPATDIGMSNIKQRRLRTPVECHPGNMVGESVPFYFCPRSVMLCVISYRNHPALTYKGGQEPIVHLEADLGEVIDWADGAGVAWAFTTANAGAAYATFHATLSELDQVNWAAIAARDWRDPALKDGKQAEFLVHGRFPWQLVRNIGVHNHEIKTQAETAIATATHQPSVTIQRDWYY